MGLFSQLPEEPAEWAGLPSEPARPQTDAERLADAAPASAGSVALAGDARDIRSIEIPLDIESDSEPQR